MTLEDPFYVVKDEVFKALNKTRGLYLRWQELVAAATPPYSPEAEWTSTELKNALRSIQWDLEDLEDTISIVEKNSSKFKIDNKEITDRRKFIDNTRKEVKMMRDLVSKQLTSAGGAWQARAKWRERYGSPLPSYTPEEWMSPQDHWYTPREEASSPLIPKWPESPPLARSLLAEFDKIAAEDELAALQAGSVKLKHVSLSISDEVNEQQILMEDLSADTEQSGSHILSASLLTARTIRSASGSRQRWAIAGLMMLLGLVGVLFVVL